ncbi:2'-5' RNA ligase family protein [Novosphingobium sp. PASSN1]|uniref:2'-5' RNA ligase family protein n=1 Tax=Novosphingobium sp. PASSN1 TaxID=2015561 RepID=UPI0025F24525|nr:2'-5' RNA ligase family protein [Novosphingobium sp. PASSN1]
MPKLLVPAPLVLTAELPAALQGRADALRRAHYPAERNHVPAHVTLLRALPPFVEDEARSLLAALAAEMPPQPALLAGITDLGTGTALAIESPAMLALRAMIADHFHGMLTVQDEGVPRLHVTVQNKVLRGEAKALQAALGPAILPERFTFAALALHRYRGGPWEPAGRWPFRGRTRR